MKALRYYGPGDIRYAEMEGPRLVGQRDAIVRMEACSICGSDLHIYHGRGFSEDTGFCIGHEAVGEIVEVGRDVKRLKPGDKVMLSAAVGCGDCHACHGGRVLFCERGENAVYGLSSQLEGLQAEAFRVPAADCNAVRIPDGITLEQALMLTDAMATAWFGTRRAEVVPGCTAVVVGLGPIGLMAVESALVMGASRVFAIDPILFRRQVAEEIGAVALTPEKAIDAIREATLGQMVDHVVEAVGSDATIDLALRLTAARGTVSSVGVPASRKYAFPIERAFVTGITFRAGICSVPEEWPALIPLLRARRLRPERFISHILALDQGAEAYRLLDSRESGVLKVAMTP